MSRCPQCGNEGDPEADYTPGYRCHKCDYLERATPVEAEPPVEASEPEDSRGVVLRLVPPAASNASIEQQRANCRKILLDTLNRVENGEVDELVLATVNSKQATSPYTFRWQLTDPVRAGGLLGVLQVKFSMPPFVLMTGL